MTIGRKQLRGTSDGYPADRHYRPGRDLGIDLDHPIDPDFCARTDHGARSPETRMLPLR
jgi:hypothetical protein